MDVKVTPESLADLLRMIDKNVINLNTGKTVFDAMFETGKPAKQIVEERGLAQISDDTVLMEIIDEVIAQNPDPAANFRAGKEQAMGFLIGQVMRATRGKANPKMAGELLRRALTGE